ncbi:MAG: prolyl-tRNA synthetase [Myxococcota bacterium]|jgi:prolyl-tRNA synthetase
MRMSALHIPTLKEAPKEAEIPSHTLMIRGGYIRQAAAGIYSFLPLAMRSIHKVEAIVRQELERAGAQEVLLPTVQPADLWEESGRWTEYGPELLRFTDRKGSDFCYAPTAEEVITALVRRDVSSWRSLPVNLYQVANKFRDEVRPRAGLMRGREFIMKDGYSFDVDEDAAGVTYDAMFEAYNRIFTRCGLAFRPVEADSGAIGGSRSHEFQVLADTGEDSIVSCKSCSYTANVEKAELHRATNNPELAAQGEAAMETVETPGARTIQEVAAFLKVKKKKILKSILFTSNKGPVLALIRGDAELNEFKVKAAAGVETLEMSEAQGPWVHGFIGPIAPPQETIVVADDSVRGMADFVVGANEADKHRVGVNLGRDLVLSETYDLRLAKNRDRCGRCGGTFQFFRGIEVGHVFFLGTKYSEPMKCNYLDAEGIERPMVMGCYGIGITRILAAAIEQNHDEHGIQWPVPLAPWEVSVLSLNNDDEAVVEAAAGIYAELREAGIEVVLDDRIMRPGGKFKDADLIGFPYQVVVGSRGMKDGMVEIKDRKTNEKQLVTVAQAAAQVAETVRAARAGSAA